MVSRELDKECVIVFDEAHNIDNVCIEVRLLCCNLSQTFMKSKHLRSLSHSKEKCL